ncbi:MAG: fimbria/pilus outer membrane usher protein [Pseudomonas sp.]|nr:fimbria/pilus outer membrane usher protein [Pseudomonas sp.]
MSVSATYATATTVVNDVTPRLLTIELNGVDVRSATFLLDSLEQGVLVPAAELAAWGLTLSQPINTVLYKDKIYYPLRQFENVQYSIDGASQALILQVGARQLSGSTIDLDKSKSNIPQTDALGAFFNYDVMHETSFGADNATSAAFELAGFNRLGLLTTTLLARDQNQNRKGGVVRLNSTLRYDDPSKLRTLTLGDTYSRSDAWGRSVLYGGIQWGTNFGTRPDFITFPMPDMRGEAVVPSSVEIYANDRRQGQDQLNAGPFSINNIPVMTGTNDLRMVVRDVLGREQVIEQSFYASQQMLRTGLHDYNYEIGSIREDYSLHSNKYGRDFVTASHQLGFNNRFTGGGRLEALKNQQTAGLSGVWLASPRFGTVSTSVAGSTAEIGDGGLASLGIEHQGQRFNFGANTTVTTERFRQIGLFDNELAPRQILRANIGASIFNGKSVGLNYIEIDRRNEIDSRVVSANYSMGILRGVFFSLYASQELESRDTFIGLTVSASLGERTSASINHTRNDDSYSNSVQFQRNLPRGNGFGYNVSTEEGHGEPSRSNARMIARTDYGTYSAEAARFRGDTAYRLNASGGVVLLGGNAFATRRIDDSFSVVKVGDYPNVTVYNENQKVSMTNSNGVALISDLRSFEENRISFEQSDLPLDARLESRNAIIVPGFRRGVLVGFDVASANGALLTVLQANGEPLPAGTTIRDINTGQRFPVARRGEAWVTDLKVNTQFLALWGDNVCRFSASMPANPGPMPRIGPLLCQETP